MSINRAYYSATIEEFLHSDVDTLLGQISRGSNDSSILQTQRNAWMRQIEILQVALLSHKGTIYFEYSIPRMGKRIDVILLIGPAIMVLEFKVGEKIFSAYGFDQVFDYALDLKNFHEASHHQFIVPILLSTHAKMQEISVIATPQNDKIFFPVKVTQSRCRKLLMRRYPLLMEKE